LRAGTITPTSVEVGWTTDQPGNSTSFHLPAAGGPVVVGPSDPQLRTDHALTIEGLAPSTAYAIGVMSSNPLGNQGLPPSIIVSTLAAPAAE
jgi:hypothetical protein